MHLKSLYISTAVTLPLRPFRLAFTCVPVLKHKKDVSPAASFVQEERLQAFEPRNLDVVPSVRHMPFYFLLCGSPIIANLHYSTALLLCIASSFEAACDGEASVAGNPLPPASVLLLLLNPKPIRGAQVGLASPVKI